MEKSLKITQAIQLAVSVPPPALRAKHGNFPMVQFGQNVLKKRFNSIVRKELGFKKFPEVIVESAISDGNLAKIFKILRERYPLPIREDRSTYPKETRTTESIRSESNMLRALAFVFSSSQQKFLQEIIEEIKKTIPSDGGAYYKMKVLAHSANDGDIASYISVITEYSNSKQETIFKATISYKNIYGTAIAFSENQAITQACEQWLNKHIISL